LADPAEREQVTVTIRIEAVHPVVMSSDVARSIEFFERLGFEFAFADSTEDTRYAGVRRDDIELHLQWHDASQFSYPTDRPAYRFVVADVEGLHARFAGAGVKDMTRVFNTAWGTCEFHVRDPDGNGLQFYRALCESRQPRVSRGAAVTAEGGRSLSERPDSA
jgi:catechol 2,3-dioxygenase-like lactoylglutathione lyase family enzyme